MKNVTITLDEQTAHWARVEAAKSGKSLSRWIGERLELERQRDAEPVSPLEEFLSGPGYPGVAAALPERETLYAERDLPGHEHPDLQPRSGRRRQAG
jgi:hypothetical protein